MLPLTALPYIESDKTGSCACVCLRVCVCVGVCVLCVPVTILRCVSPRKPNCQLYFPQKVVCIVT